MMNGRVRDRERRLQQPLERMRKRDGEGTPRYKFLSRDKSVAHFKTNFEPIPKQ